MIQYPTCTMNGLKWLQLIVQDIAEPLRHSGIGIYIHSLLKNNPKPFPSGPPHLNLQAE